MVEDRQKNAEQLRIMATDGKSRKLLELVLAIVKNDMNTLSERMIRSNEWNDVRAYQGGIRALKELTKLNPSIEPRTSPVTPEESSS